MTTTIIPGGKNCRTCPSLLAGAAQQTEVLGVYIGGPVCGLKLIPIGRPNATDPNVTKLVAEGCSDYGKPVGGWDPEVKNKPIELRVAMPDMTAISAVPSGVKPDSCTNCKNFIPATPAKTKLGWNAGFCRAKGSLLLQNRYRTYARDCDKAETTWTPMSPLAADAARDIEIIMFPEYQNGYGKIDLMAGLRAQVDLNRNASLYWQDYPTDGELSEKAKTVFNVRAWRRIVDPTGYGPSVVLPIFNFDKLPDEDKAFVPKTGDDEAPEEYIDHSGLVYTMAALWHMEQTPAVWGEPGMGKTELFRHLAWLMAAPFTLLSINEHTDIDDLIGKMMFSPELGTYFNYGLLPLAWDKINVIDVDEPNTAPPAVWQELRPLLDNGQRLVVHQNKNEVRKRHKCCYMGMSMNPAWDIRNVGTASLSDADGRRLMHIEVPMPPEDIEREIITNRLLREKWEIDEAKKAVDLLLGVAPTVRELSRQGTLSVSWGIAQQIKAAMNMRYFHPVKAFQLAIGDMLETSQRETLLDPVRAFVGEE